MPLDINNFSRMKVVTTGFSENYTLRSVIKFG